MKRPRSCRNNGHAAGTNALERFASARSSQSRCERSRAPRASDEFHFGFRVDAQADVDAWAQRLRGRGVAITTEPERRGFVYVFRVADPDGYVIEIFAFV